MSDLLLFDSRDRHIHRGIMIRRLRPSDWGNWTIKEGRLVESPPCNCQQCCRIIILLVLIINQGSIILQSSNERSPDMVYQVFINSLKHVNLIRSCELSSHVSFIFAFTRDKSATDRRYPLSSAQHWQDKGYSSGHRWGMLMIFGVATDAVPCRHHRHRRLFC